MKLMVITQNAPLYLGWFLDRFAAGALRAGHSVIVTRLSPRFKKSWRAEVWSRFEFYGPAAFLQVMARIVAAKLLAALPAGLRGGRCASVGNVLSKHGLTAWTPPSVNDAEFIGRLRAEGVDLVVSIASPQIFRSELLRAPRLGCINYHTALLPKHRGRQPLFWALLEGDAETGVSVHEMNEALDDGPILVQRRIPIGAGDTLHDLYMKTMPEGVPALLEAVEMLARGDARRLPNPREQATQNRFPTSAEAQRFRRLGRRFF